MTDEPGSNPVGRAAEEVLRTAADTAIEEMRAAAHGITEDVDRVAHAAERLAQAQGAVHAAQAAQAAGLVEQGRRDRESDDPGDRARGVVEGVVGAVSSALSEGLAAASGRIQGAAHLAREGAAVADRAIDHVADGAADRVQAADRTTAPLTNAPLGVPPTQSATQVPVEHAGNPPSIEPGKPGAPAPTIPDKPHVREAGAVEHPYEPGRPASTVTVETPGAVTHQEEMHVREDGAIVFSRTEVETVETLTKDAHGVVGAGTTTVEHQVDRLLLADGSSEVNSTERVSSDQATDTGDGITLEHTSSETVHRAEDDGQGHAKERERSDVTVSTEEYDDDGRLTSSSTEQLHSEDAGPVAAWGVVREVPAAAETDWGGVTDEPRAGGVDDGTPDMDVP